MNQIKETKKAVVKDLVFDLESGETKAADEQAEAIDEEDEYDDEEEDGEDDEGT
jgi:hypothetical protein